MPAALGVPAKLHAKSRADDGLHFAVLNPQTSSSPPRQEPFNGPYVRAVADGKYRCEPPHEAWLLVRELGECLGIALFIGSGDSILPKPTAMFRGRSPSLLRLWINDGS